MRKVGRIITEAAPKVWEKMKPILMEKLKDVGKVVLETAKMIIIKVGEELILLFDFRTDWYGFCLKEINFANFSSYRELLSGTHHVKISQGNGWKFLNTC